MQVLPESLKPSVHASHVALSPAHVMQSLTSHATHALPWRRYPATHFVQVPTASPQVAHFATVQESHLFALKRNPSTHTHLLLESKPKGVLHTSHTFLSFGHVLQKSRAHASQRPSVVFRKPSRQVSQVSLFVPHALQFVFVHASHAPAFRRNESWHVVHVSAVSVQNLQFYF